MLRRGGGGGGGGGEGGFNSQKVVCPRKAPIQSVMKSGTRLHISDKIKVKMGSNNLTKSRYILRLYLVLFDMYYLCDYALVKLYIFLLCILRI